DHNGAIDAIDGRVRIVWAAILPFDQHDGALQIGQGTQTAKASFDRAIAGSRVRIGGLQGAAEAFDRIDARSLCPRRSRQTQHDHYDLQHESSRDGSAPAPSSLPRLAEICPLCRTSKFPPHRRGRIAAPLAHRATTYPKADP